MTHSTRFARSGQETLKTLALVLCLAVPAAAQTTTTSTTTATTTSPVPADVIGTWDATVTTAQGQAIPSQLKLKKEADKLVGAIASERGEMPVDAELKDKALTIRFNFPTQDGQPRAIELAGTVDGDSIKGTMSIGGQPGGTWIATRAKAATATAATATAATAATTTAAAKTDLTGTWNITVELPNMTANPTMVLKQDGEKLTGDYVSAQYGKFPIAGTVKGSDVSFSFAMNVEGNSLTVTYSAKVESDGSLKGSVGYGDMMSGTFTASRKK
jgi:hypothetical protein